MSRISVIIPCRNEAGAIEAVLRGVAAALPQAEILVVDDGSTDGTGEAASHVEGVHVLRRETSRGKGAALADGIRAATGDVLIFMDGDGQDDPRDLPRLAAEAERGCPFVNGSKFIGVIEEGGISRPNYWGNRFMSGLVNLLFGGRVTDSQSGFRAVSRELVESFTLRSTQYEIESEMLCKALKKGARVVEVPVTRKARAAGKTGFHRVRNGLRILFTILRERLAP